jgi:hypothetical protein
MTKDEKDLSARIAASTDDEPVNTTLTTNERVLARITDGIYRQPASALRELISNAYDADATEVIILTDAPQFESITVRDDGDGMSANTLAHMLKNIGGSAKRTTDGKDLNITAVNTNFSRKGRKLIGKLGIGLFAVAQFTRHFVVITKQKNDKYRTVADITLGAIEGERITKAKTDDRSDKPEIETGKARIYRERVSRDEYESHGTEIRLVDLLPRTKAELASMDWWARLDFQNQQNPEDIDHETKLDPPKFHIGRIDLKNPGKLLEQESAPWEVTSAALEKFRSFVDSVREQAFTVRELVDLEKLCDRYLQTIWTLALASPIDYLQSHPFDLEDDDVMFFRLSNTLRGQSTQLSLKRKETPRTAMKLTAGGKHGGFRVEIDGVQLARPIVFESQPKGTAALTTPLLFVGACREEFKGKPRELSGGPLEFEAYLFWTPKVVPTQHQGVLIRVGNATGALFDRTFMGYPVSEQTRLRQITAEIFIKEGFEAAINLDRESFNYSHPHYQFVLKWLHSAIRQLANKSKELGKAVRADRLKKLGTVTRKALDNKVAEMLESRGVDDLPRVEFLTENQDSKDAARLRRDGALAFRRAEVLPTSVAQRRTGVGNERAALVEKKVIAVAQILSTWGLLKELRHEQQEQLLREIAEVMLFEGEQ